MKLPEMTVRDHLAFGKLPLFLPLREARNVYIARAILVLMVAIVPLGLAIAVVAFARWPFAALLVTASLSLLGAWLLIIPHISSRRSIAERVVAMSSQLQEKFSKALSVLAPMALIAVGFATTSTGDGNSSALQISMTLLAVLLGILSFRPKRSTDNDDEMAVSLRPAFAAAIALPPIEKDGQDDGLGEAEDSADDPERIVAGALETLKVWCARESGRAEVGLRVSFYQLAGDNYLRLNAWTGEPRRTAPRSRFGNGRNTDDRSVLKIARGESALLVRDLRAASSHRFSDYQNREYRSLITAPVRLQDRSFGILAVDSVEANALNENDVSYVLYFANRLAHCLREVEFDADPTEGAPSINDVRAAPISVPHIGQIDDQSDSNVVITPVLTENELGLISGKITPGEYAQLVVSRRS